MKQWQTGFGNIIEIGFVAQCVGEQFPLDRKSLIPELKTSIHPEHHNRFVQTIERLALGFDHRIIPGLQAQLGGDIPEQKKQPAHWVSLPGHPQGPIIRKMPLIFANALKL
ncbi:MAG: Uncharacterised protein [Hyphomonas sp. TMED17]|nr:MAG: Uncharacterised protein [Hyphomonas sp. TMED17]